MAQKRRGGGGGFRPPELKGTLGTLLRTAVDQASGLIGQGRARLDDARHQRRRQDALAELGEVVLDLVRRGEIDLGELPEAQAVIRQLDEMDDGGDEQVATPKSRQRFDARGGDDGTVSSGAKVKKPAGTAVWRPPSTEPLPPSKAMPASAKKGGITFEDDDLADYMHPDDVPPKPPASDE